MKREIIDTLNEAARYMRTRPEESRRLIDAADGDIRQIGMPSLFRERLTVNLHVAYKYAQVEPDVAAGYCRGAAFEIQAYGG